MRTTILAAAVVTASLLAASVASAQRRGPQPPRDEHLLFAQVWLGVGDCGGHWCGEHEGNTAPSFGTGAGVYIRPIPYFAAGIDGHFNWMGAEHEDRNREAELGTYGLLNLSARGIVPVSRVDLWGGLGFGFAWWGYSWDRDDRSEDISLSGVDFAFSLGADVHITEGFWLGGMLRFALPIWGDRCRERVDRDGSFREDCDPVSDLDPEDQDELPGVLWFTGVTGRFDFL